MTTSPHSVVVVDDQAPFRLAAKAVLRRLPCFELAGEASSGPEAIELVEVLHPALVLMDINMPEMNGIEATRQIVSAHPDVGEASAGRAPNCSPTSTTSPDSRGRLASSLPPRTSTSA